MAFAPPGLRHPPQGFGKVWPDSHAGQDFDERGLELGIPGIGRPSDRTPQLVPRDAAQVPDSPGLAGMGGPHFGDPLAEGRKDTPPQGNRRTCTRGFITNM